MVAVAEKSFSRTDFEAFIGGLKYPPNRFQMTVLESVAFGSGNKLVSALAGSGKTTLLVQIAHLLKAMGEHSAMFLAFNVTIRDELQQRLPAGYTAINSHRLGNNALKAVQPKTRVDKAKMRAICRSSIEGMQVERSEVYNMSRSLEALTSKVMLNGADPKDTEAIGGLVEHYGLENVDLRIIMAVQSVIAEAKRMWEQSGEICFDEMIYWPVMLNLDLPKHRFVAVDESQDLNRLQQQLAIRSLASDGRAIVVGDARQSMYGFSGADSESFDRMKSLLDAEVLPLNICYRCPTQHLDLAREIVPEIEASPNAKSGEVIYLAEEDLHKHVQRGSLVMCRVTAPLISTYFDMITRRIPAKVLGRELSKDLASTLDRVAKLEGFRYDKIVEYLEKWERMQVVMLMQKTNGEEAVEMLRDKVECLTVCATNFTECKDLDCLKRELEVLFADDDSDWKNRVTLCTVHKAKGLEADETFILKPDKMPLSWPNQKPWQLEQEHNILYVALTRSKNKLHIVGDEEEFQARLDHTGLVEEVRFAETPEPVVEVPPEEPPQEEPVEFPPVVPEPAPALPAPFRATGDLAKDMATVKSPKHRLVQRIATLTDEQAEALLKMIELLAGAA